MNFGMVVTAVLVGATAGWVAGRVMKDGGYGLAGDMILGLVGSIVGSVIFRGLEISPGAGLVALAGVAFVGATVAIVVQRKLLNARA